MAPPLDALLVHQGKAHASDSPAYLMPMGLLSMADWLSRAGHRAEVLHLPIEVALDPGFALGAAVRETSPRLVCFDLHWHQQSRAVIDTAQHLRQDCPDVAIVLGGYTASACAEEILERFDCVDYVIRGDGEVPLLRLLETLQAGGALREVPNLTYRQGRAAVRSEPLHVNGADELAAFTYSRFELLRHHRLYTQAGIMEGEIRLDAPFDPGTFYCNCGRGCPYDCTFCGGGHEAQQRIGGRTHFVHRPIEAMLADLHRMGEHNLDTWYNTFDPSPDPSYFLELFQRIRESGLRISMIHECLHLPSEEFLRSFADTFGPRSRLDFVLLTASDELRRKNKDNYFSRADLMRCLERLEQLSVRGDLCFLTGLPFEEERHVQESIALCEEIGRRFNHIGVNAEVLAIEPLAPMNRDPHSYGIESTARSFMDYYRGHAAPRFYGFRPAAYSVERAHDLALEHERVWRNTRNSRKAHVTLGADSVTRSGVLHPGPAEVALPPPRCLGELDGDRALVQLHDVSLWDGGWRYGLGIPSLIAYGHSRPELAAGWCFEHRAWRAGRPGRADPTADAVLELVLATRPRLVGFTLTVWSARIFKEAIRRIKAAAPEVALVAGGPLVAGTGASLLEELPELDFLVHGYGELPFAGLLCALGETSPDPARLAATAGLQFRIGSSVQGTTTAEVLPPHAVPSPLRSGLLDLDECPTLHVEWSRGCPTSCAYCNWGNASRRVQRADRERILDDLAFARERGFEEITLNDAALNHETDRLAELCEAVAEGSRFSGLRFVGFLRYEHLDEEQLDLLRQVEWKSLVVGVQSDDDETLRTVGRPPFDRAKLTWAVDALARFTRPGVQLITGLPGDTYDAFLRRIEHLRELDAELTVFPLQAPPGSRLYRDRERLGLHPDPEREYYVFGTDTLSPREHARCLEYARRRLTAGADEPARAAHGVAATAGFWDGLAHACARSRPLVQLHQANLDDSARSFGLGVPFLISHARAQPDLAERYELLQSVWEVDAPDHFRCDPLEMVEAVVRDAPAVVGFSLHPWSYRRFLRVIAAVKQRRPDICVVVGGSNATLEGAKLLEEVAEIDVVISGEGERPFAALLRALAEEDPARRGARLATIGNLWARHDGAVVGGGYERYGAECLDPCGDPLGDGLVHLLPGRSHLNLEWTRGCPNQCAYCAWSRGQRTLRRFSRARIASDLRWAVDHGFDEIVICDAAINYDDALLRGLCETLLSTAPKLRYSCFVHWPLLTEAQVAIMQPLRWNRLMIGLQTDDDHGLAVLGRDPFDREQLERSVRLLHPLARPYLELMTGIPGDTAEGLRRRVDYALSLDCRVSLFPLLAARGTKLRSRVQAAGALLDSRQHVVTELPTLPRQEYRAVIAELSARDLPADRLELAGYDFLDLDGKPAGEAQAQPPPADPAHGVAIAPGQSVFLHQAFTCCPYAALITAKIHDFFEQNGCEVTDDPEGSALQVINTCGFNEERSARAIKAIRQLQRRAPHTPMVVAGCLTRIEAERVRDPLSQGPPWRTIGPHEHGLFDTLLTQTRVAFEDVRTNRYMERYSSGDPRLPLYQVLVSTGCLNQCSYCVIRHAKGNVRSRPLAEILAEVDRGLALGHRDILLVGDDISAWGADVGSNVAALLAALARIDGDVRFSAEAFEPSRLLEHLDETLNAFASGRFAWIVLPVQSGSDRVLRAMNRRYTRADIEEAVAKLRRAAPALVITTDLLYGFGDETAEELEQTLALGAIFDYCDFNVYEPRPGTPPMTMSAEELRRRRSRVEEFRRDQGSQVEKLVFCDLESYTRRPARPASRDDEAFQPAPGVGADYVAAADAPAALLPSTPSSGAAGTSAEPAPVPAPVEPTPSAWVVRHAPRLRSRVAERGAALAAGWRVGEVREDLERVVLVVDHDEGEEPLEFMVSIRDESRPCIAHSADYNLGLIWETEAPCELNPGQIEALTALQRLLDLVTEPPE
ncbi:MAG: radical SAM protein [bacterium]